MFDKLINSLKEPIKLLQILGYLVTIGTLLFYIGSFYNKFTSIESKLDFKLDDQAKTFKEILSQQTDRIQNLENALILQSGNFENMRREIVKRKKHK